MTHAPSDNEKRVLLLLAVIYGALTLAVLPWAEHPGPRVPAVIAVCNGGLAIADICTALLLGREYRRAGKASVLLLACAYLYSAAMALVHASVFSGAFFDAPAFGGPQTVIWVYLFWRLGTGGLLLAGALATIYAENGSDPQARQRREWKAYAATLAACAAMAGVAAHIDVPMIVGTKFTLANFVAIYLYLGMLVSALAVLWRRRAVNDVLYLWLAVFITALIAEQIVGSLSGAQYTVGWHISKASSALSSCLLLVFWLAHVRGESSAQPSAAASYGAALGAVLGALVLRWFLTPWIGLAYPFGTLFGAIAIAVWIGGWRPAVFAALLGFVGAAYLFIDPVGSFIDGSAADLFGAALYFVSCALIIGLGDAMRRASERYRRSEALFRSSQEAALQGFTLFEAVRDAQGRVQDLRFRYVNPAGAIFSRRPAEELLGRTLKEVFPGADTIGIAAALRRVVETGEPLDTEVHYSADGLDGWFRHLAVKIGDGVGTSYIDVTHNKRLEGELRQRAAELQRADEKKSHFLAMLSHELRNPLAPLVHGMALLRLRRDPAAAGETQAMMERQLAHLRRLIDDLLDVSRIDRGKLELRRERVALDAVLRNAADAARPNLEAKSHQLVLRGASEVLHVEGDDVRLCQVVLNLLNNAAKFTPAGGRIELALRREGESAVVEVRDNGIGFAAEEREAIFDLFFQLKPSHAEPSGGLGLGLSVARSLVEMHGGRIEAESAGAGRGATLIVRLPLAQPAEEQPPVAQAVLGESAGRRILVVDDNVDAADTLAAILRLQGFEVRSSHDGASALRAARDFHPQTVLIDLNMPGMGGLELARALRGQERGERIRLIALTGMGQPSDVEASLRSGFDDHLTKPAPVEEVLRAVGVRRSSVALDVGRRDRSAGVAP
jgi:signal transduction histidine kinase/CheY-like chemotaxis protein